MQSGEVLGGIAEARPTLSRGPSAAYSESTSGHSLN